MKKYKYIVEYLEPIGLEEELNETGKEGWELVSNNERRFIFKKELN